MSRRVVSLVVISGVLTLVGCSGGGGGGDPAAPAAITAGNATLIAASVMGAAQNAADLGQFTFFGPTTTLAFSSKSILAAKVADVRNAGLDALMRRAQAIPLAPISPDTTPCADAGRVTLSGDVAAAGTLTPNDTIALDFALCVEGAVTVNGRFSMQVVSFSGDFASGTYSLNVGVQLSDLEVTIGGEATTMNGSVSLDIDAVASGTVTTTVTSTSISVARHGSTSTFSNYSSTTTTLSGAFARDVSGSLTSSAFSGSVTFSTTTLLQGACGCSTDAGQVVITGANGGTITVVVLDATFVRLKVDTNGDGTVDATFDVTWTDLT